MTSINQDTLTVVIVAMIGVLVYMLLFWLIRKFVWPMAKPYLPPWESRPPDPCMCCRRK